MTKHYEFVILKKPNFLSPECITVAYVRDRLTRKSVMIVML